MLLKNIWGMAMRRRFFLRLSGLFAVAVFAGIPLPAFVTKDKKKETYPGKIMRFDNFKTSTEGPWAG